MRLSILIGRGLDLRKRMFKDLEISKAIQYEVLRVRKVLKVSGDNGEKVPPVPIPNTEVKLLSAESTWLATAREDRSSPDSKAACEFRRRFFFAFWGEKSD